MGNIYDEEALDELEQEEHALTEETMVLLLLLLVAFHSELEAEVRSFFQKYGKNGVVTYADARKYVSASDHRRRLSVLLLWLHDRIIRFRDEVNPKFLAMLKSVIRKEADFFDVDVDDIDMRWGADNADWWDRLRDDVLVWEAYLANEIKRGILTRSSVDKILEQIDKRVTTIENVLRGLATTETTAIGTLARREIFKELGVSKYKYYARADERTCDVCGSMHGLIFPMTAYEPGVTASPMHPRCRCWEVPIRE